MTPADDSHHAALHRLLEKLGEGSDVLRDLRGYLEALDAYYSATTAGLLRRGRMLLRAAAIIGVGSVVALAITAKQVGKAAQLAQRADNAAARVEKIAAKNTLAIRVGCTLIVNLITDAGVGEQPSDTQPSERQRAQQALNDLLVLAITQRVLTAPERARARRLARVVASAGALVSTPDCDEIAKHPEDVVSELPGDGAVILAPVHPNP